MSSDVRISELTSATSLSSTDQFLLETGNGTNSVSYETMLNDFASNVVPSTVAEEHNNIYRGKQLTDMSSIASAISSGTFNDLYIGDYISVQSEPYIYRIAGFNILPALDIYKTMASDGSSLTGYSGNTVCFVPDGTMGSSSMEIVDDAQPFCYYNATAKNYLWNTVLPTVRSDFAEIGEIVLYHDRTSDIRDGNNFSMSGFQATVELLSETMLFDTSFYGNTTVDIGSIQSQLPLFRLNPQWIVPPNMDYMYWLRTRDASNPTSNFVYVDDESIPRSEDASLSYGIRPFFFIGVPQSSS